MRRSTVFLAGLAFLAASLALAGGHAALRRASAAGRIEETRALVRRLELTDLCLSTEARYTRHPSQADRFSAFQDHPMSLEHFPSGSAIPPRKKGD